MNRNNKDLYRMYEEESKSLRKAWREANKKTISKPRVEKPKQEIHISENEKAEKIIAKKHYSTSKPISEEDIRDDLIEVIEEGDFGNMDYENTSIICFSDGIFVDDELYPLTDGEIIDIIGGNAYAEFCAYKAMDSDIRPDAFCVRNHYHQCDYEFTIDERTYDEFKGMMV